MVRLLLRISILGLIVGCLLPSSQPKLMPQVIIDDSVAADFALLTEKTWGTFLATFAARADCFDHVWIVATKDLSDRAGYDPATATVFVRVPERGSLLRIALVHEWAHHLEFQCAAHTELRSTFLEAQGFPPDTPWHQENGTTNMPPYLWAKIPSEQFAETVVAIVLEDRMLRTSVPITDDGIQVILDWARKKSTP